jgi:hypothetical protein
LVRFEGEDPPQMAESFRFPDPRLSSGWLHSSADPLERRQIHLAGSGDHLLCWEIRDRGGQRAVARHYEGGDYEQLAAAFRTAYLAALEDGFAAIGGKEIDYPVDEIRRAFGEAPAPSAAQPAGDADLAAGLLFGSGTRRPRRSDF